MGLYHIVIIKIIIKIKFYEILITMTLQIKWKLTIKY